MGRFIEFVEQSGLKLKEQNLDSSSAAELRPEMARGNTLAAGDRLDAAAQSFVDDIKDLDVYEKASLINSYVNDRIKFTEQKYGSPEDTRPFSGIFENGSGDCDDYGYAKAVMLRAAGIDEVNVVAANVKYNFAAGSSSDAPHVLVVIENKADSKFYALDNLAGDLVPLGSDLKSEKKDLVLPLNAQDGPAQMEITKILGIDVVGQGGQEKFFTPAEENPTIPMAVDVPRNSPATMVSP